MNLPIDMHDISDLQLSRVTGGEAREPNALAVVAGTTGVTAVGNGLLEVLRRKGPSPWRARLGRGAAIGGLGGFLFASVAEGASKLGDMLLGKTK